MSWEHFDPLGCFKKISSKDIIVLKTWWKWWLTVSQEHLNKIS